MQWQWVFEARLIKAILFVSCNLNLPLVILISEKKAWPYFNAWYRRLGLISAPLHEISTYFLISARDVLVLNYSLLSAYAHTLNV